MAGLSRAKLRVLQALTWSIIQCATLIVHGQTPSPADDARPLPFGTSLKRSIERDDSHFYYLEMKAGEILRLEAREKSTDLKCWLVKVADEKWVAHSISPFDRATLSFISEEAGWYILLVAAQGYTTGKASYEITATRNSATAEEWERLRAEALSEKSAYISEDSDLKGLLKATQQLEESLKFWTRVKDPYWEAFVHYSLGRLNFRIGEFGKALVEFNRACLLFRNARDLNGEAWSRNNLGLVHHALGDQDNAYKELDQANHLFAQLGDPYGAITTVNNLGLVYMDIGRPETALAYYEQALPVLREFGDLRGEAAALTNIGKIYGGFGDAKKELEHSQQALQLFRRIGDQSMKP